MAPRFFLPLVSALALTACSLPPDGDYDEDGITNGEEESLGTDPRNPDSDGDGLNDGDELDAGADPLVTDSDGDGMNDGDEVAAGADPTNEDSDNDGLTDGEEVDLGTDPASADSDGDGYPDGAEIDAGTDPSDASSMIYAGGWPYNADKDEMEDPGFSGPNKKGDTMPRIVAKDQFGDMVDLYDFAGQDKFIIVDMSASWCGYCVELAKWLDHNPNNYYSQNISGWDDTYGPLRDAIDNGDIYWITFLGENNSGGSATGNTVKAWYNAYPHDGIPVLADKNKDLVNWWGLSGWPSFMLVNENMTIKNRAGLTQVFDAALQKLQN